MRHLQTAIHCPSAAALRRFTAPLRHLLPSTRAGLGRPLAASGRTPYAYMSNGDPPDEPEATAGWGAVAQFPDPDPLDRGGWGAAAVAAGVGGEGPQHGVVGWGGLPSGAAPATAVAAAPAAAVVDAPVPALPEEVVAASTVGAGPAAIAAGLTSPAAAYMTLRRPPVPASWPHATSSSCASVPWAPVDGRPPVPVIYVTLSSLSFRCPRYQLERQL